ncbi:MAG: CHASE2 domain-containing protein [Alphaproteobacteria bacterium]|nr:CHASE2 domain-containing protein [Alphaproteobacteria bacterium]MBU1512484.1 CHASE2 domain-containing protein [Alphaproteobacteria bacterium]MBU2096592.1 CHASE2 domain-containing protein [Alphaproteobacteria bacterium]MBU2151590.1 CHASE2 domain-containing protein [Alphaproteobacteria bacterium]MBU2307307.1 CHASE2 domain-containing protein [Alphaproteobacteria bacterium]
MSRFKGSPKAIHAALLALSVFLSGALLLFIEPFDLDRAAGAAGRSAFYKVAAFAYPGRERPGPVPIEIVQADDRLLADEELAWPMPYGTHAAVIDAISEAGPRALFVDFLFVDTRPDPDFDELVAAIERAASRHMVFIAAAPEEVLGRPARQELVALARRNPRVQLVSVRLGRSIADGRAYPLRPDPDGRVPAAVALCRTIAGCRVATGEDVDVWWGAQGYKGVEATAPGRALNFVTTAVLGDFTPRPLRLTDPLPQPFTTLTAARDLLKGDTYDAAIKRLHGAVVLYGGNFAFTGDVAQTPVYGLVPGSHVHAMVLDNLARSALVRIDPPFGLGPKGHQLLSLALICLVLGAWRLAWPTRSSAATEGRKLELRFGDMAVLALAALAIALFEFAVLKVGPIAWFPVLLAALGADALVAPLLERILQPKRAAGD